MTLQELGGQSNITSFNVIAVMLKSYLKITLRNLSRNGIYSIINITGLALGITVAMLICLWIWDEVSFNAYHKNYKRVAQVMVNQSNDGETYTGSTVAMPVGEALASDYKADFKHVSLTSFSSDHLLGWKDRKLSRRGIWVQHGFPHMFSLEMKNGTADGIKDPSTILLSSSLAKALFADADPVGQVIRLDNTMEMKVGGVYEDLPHNSTFHKTDLLLPWGNKANELNSRTEWDNHNGQLFVQLADGTEWKQVGSKIKKLPTPFIKDWNETLLLHPMNKVHLYDKFEQGRATGGRIEFVWLFGIIGLFVLILACINFMNLSTARSAKRAREVGIRKAIGSLQRQLVGQFLYESVFLAFVAFFFALLIVQLALPFFNELSAKEIRLPIDNPFFWLSTFSFTVLTGIVSGSYPAFYLSSFQPTKVLKGSVKAGKLAVLPRKILVVFQFTISIALIIATAVVFRQIQHSKDRPAGYTRQGLITLPAYSAEMQQHYEAIKSDLLQSGAIQHMAASSQSAAHFSNNNSLDWNGKDPGNVVFFRNVSISAEFGQTIGWSVIKGRDFSKNFGTDSASVIINEAAAKVIGFKNPVGESVGFETEKYTIVGVVNDMITQSPYDPAEPSVFFLKGWKGIFTVRVNPSVSIREALGKIEAVIKKYTPAVPFSYSFVDEDYARKFSNETKIGNLASLFASLAIFISCLGLFGLASFVAEQRTKEIGVRKVLGAKVVQIWSLLSADFLLLVMIAFLIASPLAYIMMHKWLENYSYHTSISWWIFGAAALGALLITIVTVSFQAIKAAFRNPVNSLRME